MSTSIRIKDDVFSRLEMNAKGYESVSDTVARSVLALEFSEVLEMVITNVESSIQTLNDENIAREKTLLVHYDKEAIEKAMLLAKRFFSNHTITYDIQINCLKVLVEKV